MTIRFLLALFAVLCAAQTAAAEDRDLVVTERAQSRLIPERSGFAAGETTWFALAQELAPGWHVYWKNPGDSGLPLDLAWNLPEGFEAGEALYPAPERIPVGPLANFGHEGAPVFLAPIRAPADLAPGTSIPVDLEATWLICADICVPETGRFSLKLKAGAAPDNAAAAPVFKTARTALPTPFPGEAGFDATAEKVVVSLTTPAISFRTATFFPEGEGLIEPAAEQSVEARDGDVRISMAAGYALDAETIETLPGVVVFEGRSGRVAFEVEPVRAAGLAPASPGSASMGAPRVPASLPVMLILAFMGGVILNVMPCVFPVLFIKAASLTNAAQVSRSALREQGIYYTLGVIVMFAALGALLLALRAGGESLGWGFHLQSPAVVLLSAYVLFMIGLNLAGLFHIGSSLQGVGGDLSSKPGAAGAVATGALAVFVAAPCIGPLMTAPLGAALVLPPVAAMGIFIAMALGLAAPFLALGFAPGLGRALPAPGPWMVRFRQALAFPVFAGAAFFLWVLSNQAGSGGLARALAGLLLLALAAWLFELGRAGSARAMALRAASAFSLLAALGVSLGVSSKPAEASAGAFSPARVASLRAEGTPVFVDFTAAWCVTCQFNKLTILSTETVRDAFRSRGVVVLEADWTNRDPIVTEALQSFGAAGVPLYVFYPAAGEPVVLEQPLTEAKLLAAISG